MRLILTTILIILIYPLPAQTKLTGQIKGVTKSDTIEVNILFDAWYFKQKNIVLATTNNGTFSTTLPIEKAQSIFLVYKEKKMLVYVEPKKDVFITFEKDDIENTLSFKGALEAENDLRKATGLTFFQLGSKIPNDSLTSPDYILSSIRLSQAIALTKLNEMKTSLAPAFQKMTQKDIEYFLVTKLWEIIWDKNVFSGGKIASDLPWREALQKAYNAYPVSSNDAVDSYFYQVMVANYPRYLEHTAPGKEAFLIVAERVLQKPGAEAFKELKEKGRRFWEYRAYNYGFKNVALEFALASFINTGIGGGELTWLKEAYNEYVLRFPKSRYLTYLNNIAVPYFASTSSALSANILFDQINSTDTSLTNILAKHKGKIVYIDLWGTWCGPCREEFQYNKELKAYFKDKPVDFLYIAFEHSNEPEKLWKETVNFYNLNGRHILAGKQLRASVEKMYSTNRSMKFPSYLLADKDGTIKTLFAERPSAKDALYKQIDQLLNQ